MTLTVTQFMRPDGRRKTISLEIPDDYKSKVAELQACECEITCEQMMNGQATQYISHNEGDFAIVSSNCGTDADAALLKMIKEFDTTKFNEWLKDVA